MTKLINSSTPAAPVIRPEPEQITSAYAKMLSSNPTRELGTVSTQDSPLTRDDITGEAKIEKGALTVTIKQYIEGGKRKDLRVSTQKLLDLFTIELTRINDYRGKPRNLNLEVIVPIDRYMELLDIPNTKASKDRARRVIAEDLETLYNLSFSWKDKSRKKGSDHLDARICTRKGIRRGNVEFAFTPELGALLVNAFVTQYPVELLSLDGRNKAAYHIGWKLAHHYSIRTNHDIGTADIISLNALLKDCPAIPTYEEVMETDRALERRIIQATTDAINSLPFIEDWSYCNAKKVPETEEQKEAPITLERLNSLYIHFKLKDHPEEALGEYATSGPSDK